MNFLPAQKAQFRQDVKEALSSLELIASRAGLDEFDQELMLEVVRLNGLVSSVMRTTLSAISQSHETSPLEATPANDDEVVLPLSNTETALTEAALIQEEYNAAE